MKRRPGRLLLLAGVLLLAFGFLRGEMASVREFNTYRDFDVDSDQSAVQYLSPGVPDRAHEGAYRFDGPVHAAPLYAVGTIFIIWFLLRNAGSFDLKLGIQRGLSQWVAFVLLRLGMFRVAGAARVPRCAAGVVPVLNCQACEMATGACPIGQVQQSLLNKRFPAIALGAMVVTAALLGRWICGWLCPCGMFSDILDRASRKRFRPAHAWRWGGYAALALVVGGAAVFVVAGVKGQAPFCSTFCFSGQLYGLLPYYATTAAPEMSRLAASGGLPVFLLHATVFLLWILAAILISGRVFCRYACPLGALLGLANSVAAVRVEHRAEACNGCDRCLDDCPMGIDLARGDFLTRAGCIRCGRCVALCARGARVWELPWTSTTGRKEHDAKRKPAPVPAG